MSSCADLDFSLSLLVSRRFWNRFTALKNCGWITTLCSLYQGWEQAGKKIFSMAPCYSQLIPRVPPQQCLGKLRQLRYLDLAKNRIETLDTDISGCEALEDLLLSSNMLQHLPDSIGACKRGARMTFAVICLDRRSRCVSTCVWLQECWRSWQP